MYTLALMPSHIELIQPLIVRRSAICYGKNRWHKSTIDEEKLMHQYLMPFYTGLSDIALPAGMIFTIVRRPIIFKKFSLSLRYTKTINKNRPFSMPFDFVLQLFDDNWQQPLHWKPYTP